MEGITVDGVLLALAAIGAAALAAWTANHRMERQLAEESERLRLQLLHDRRMRDREELRRTLDEAAGSVAATAEEIHGTMTVARKRLEEDAPAHQGYERLFASLSEEAHATFIQRERLEFRFARGDPIAAKFNLTYEKLRDSIELLEDPSHEALAKVDELMGEAAVAYVEFADLCRSYVGVDAPDPEPSQAN